MAFDPNNPAHLSQLNTEITTDPSIIGLSPTKSDVENTTLLNERRVTIQIDLDIIPVQIIQSAVVGSEFAALPATSQRLWIAIVSAHDGFINPENPGTRSQIAAIWTAGTTTRANLVALQTRDGSRMEQISLFGVNSFVRHQDVAAAFGRT